MFYVYRILHELDYYFVHEFMFEDIAVDFASKQPYPCVVVNQSLFLNDAVVYNNS